MLNRIRAARAEYTRKYHAAAAEASAGTLIPVRRKRVHRASFALSLVQDLPAVFTVFAASASVLQSARDAASLALVAAELIAGASVLAVIALEARHLFGRAAEHTHAQSQEK